MTTPINKFMQFLLCCPFIFLSACVSIPQAAPDLSLELGKQIRSIENSHKHFVQKFFDEKRKRVDEFIEEEWLPLFAENFLGQDFIWNTFQIIGRKYSIYIYCQLFKR